MNTYSKILDFIEKFCCYILAIFLGIMTVTMIYQVILRYIFNNANIWAEELTRFLFIWTVMLGSCIAIRKNSHLKVDMIIDLFSPKVRTFIQIFAYFIILVFLIVLTILSIELVSNTWVNKSAGLKIPMAIPYLSVTTGCIFMILMCIEFIIKKIQYLKKIDVIN